MKKITLLKPMVRDGQYLVAGTTIEMLAGPAEFFLGSGFATLADPSAETPAPELPAELAVPATPTTDTTPATPAEPTAPVPPDAGSTPAKPRSRKAPSAS